MLELFWELRQQQQLSDASAAARDAAGRVSSTERELEQVKETVQRLTLMCMGMWSLIQDKTDLTEEDLIARCREIDLEDGTADGKVTQGVVNCPKCKRPFSTKHNRCLYCGYSEAAVSAFDGM